MEIKTDCFSLKTPIEGKLLNCFLSNKSDTAEVLLGSIIEQARYKRALFKAITKGTVYEKDVRPVSTIASPNKLLIFPNTPNLVFILKPFKFCVSHDKQKATKSFSFPQSVKLNDLEKTFSVLPLIGRSLKSNCKNDKFIDYFHENKDLFSRLFVTKDEALEVNEHDSSLLKVHLEQIRTGDGQFTGKLIEMKDEMVDKLLSMTTEEKMQEIADNLEDILARSNETSNHINSGNFGTNRRSSGENE